MLEFSTAAAACANLVSCVLVPTTSHHKGSVEGFGWFGHAHTRCHDHKVHFSLVDLSGLEAHTA